MKRVLAVSILLLLVFPIDSRGGFLDDIIKQLGSSSGSSQDEGTVTSGLKEALTIGTRNAVSTVSSVDGYFGNLDIRISLPDKLKKVEKLLRKVGYDNQVNEFVLSMNRAAEHAAPFAVDIFVRAIREMTIQDALGILEGNDTAATNYFREKTHDDIYDIFKPTISTSMGKVGAVKSYNKMNRKYTSLPFVKEEPVDLEDYVTEKAMYGLFFMIGEEEKKIREDPAARITALLRKVFGS
ncbi:MAG: DUF4197 domain-containing protein, partial [bacterium]